MASCVICSQQSNLSSVSLAKQPIISYVASVLTRYNLMQGERLCVHAFSADISLFVISLTAMNVIQVVSKF